MKTQAATILKENSQLISDIKEEWGSDFENLSQSEILWVLSYITGIIVADTNDNYNPHDVKDSLVPDCEALCDEVSYEDKLELAKLLINKLTA